MYKLIILKIFVLLVSVNAFGWNKAPLLYFNPKSSQLDLLKHTVNNRGVLNLNGTSKMTKIQTVKQALSRRAECEKSQEFHRIPIINIKDGKVFAYSEVSLKNTSNNPMSLCYLEPLEVVAVESPQGSELTGLISLKVKNVAPFLIYDQIFNVGTPIGEITELQPLMMGSDEKNQYNSKRFMNYWTSHFGEQVAGSRIKPLTIYRLQLVADEGFLSDRQFLKMPKYHDKTNLYAVREGLCYIEMVYNNEKVGYDFVAQKTDEGLRSDPIDSLELDLRYNASESTIIDTALDLFVSEEKRKAQCNEEGLAKLNAKHDELVVDYNKLPKNPSQHDPIYNETLVKINTLRLKKYLD